MICTNPQYITLLLESSNASYGRFTKIFISKPYNRITTDNMDNPMIYDNIIEIWKCW